MLMLDISLKSNKRLLEEIVANAKYPYFTNIYSLPNLWRCEVSPKMDCTSKKHIQDILKETVYITLNNPYTQINVLCDLENEWYFALVKNGVVNKL